MQIESILIEGTPIVNKLNCGFTLKFPITKHEGFIYFHNDKHGISHNEDPYDPLILKYADVCYGEVLFLNDDFGIIQGRDLEFYVLSENMIKWKY